MLEFLFFLWLALEFLFFLWLVDMIRWRKWSVVFVPFGRNAIFIYMLTSLISIKAGTDVFTAPVAAHFFSKLRSRFRLYGSSSSG